MTEQNGVGRSSATDELRAELTRRGVEWWLSDDPCCEYIITHWCVEPFQWTAIEGEKDLWLNAGIAGHEPLTPEQAIAATLGRTCHNVSKWVNVFECSECGFDYDFVTEPYQGPNYCPNCGRRIEEDE